MGGRRPRSGRGSARSGPASGTPWARPATTRPPGQGTLDRADVLERAPGRWSPSRLGSPPRWLLALIAVLVLAGGVTASVAGGLRHGPAHPGRAKAPAAVLPTACTYLIGPISGATVTHDTYEPRQDAGCARPAPGRSGTGGIRPGSSSICVGLHVQAWHPASQFGIRHRCYPGLT